MSHCPGYRLEDWLTDWWRVIDADGENGTAIRRAYAGQMVLDKAQFSRLVEIYEPHRNVIEERLWSYSEEESGSWRDYCGWAFDMIPEEVNAKAKAFLQALEGSVPKTKGLRSPRPSGNVYPDDSFAHRADRRHLDGGAAEAWVLRLRRARLQAPHNQTPPDLAAPARRGCPLPGARPAAFENRLLPVSRSIAIGRKGP